MRNKKMPIDIKDVNFDEIDFEEVPELEEVITPAVGPTGCC